MGGAEAAGEQPGQQAGDWIVKLFRRRDNRKYYIHASGNTTARVDHLMLLPEADAKQLALAIRTNHPDFTARAMKLPKKFVRKAQACKRNRTGGT